MKKSRKEAFEWIKALGIAVIIAVLVRSFIFTNYVVEGKSMMPNLQDGNRLIVNKLDYEISKPNRFDIVIFHATKTEDYVKRVIGLPGDKIAYRNDVLYVNGKAMKEPYLKRYKENIQGDLTYDFPNNGTITVPKNTIWVMGDNRQNSIDSRVFGPVKLNKVVGKVNVRYWPMSKFSFLTNPDK
ncbi:signal peptidase I [Terrilactibacillus sp. BCM23-1]|uniref:Signal peptidase I n=1 Tax=Terrilactibacillus tamarindi TaxID=2599694 RepID=A0A6N8CLN1_9BACI|nr:signal peptidase I [Terrilactibacillus tamarindi]MTT30448.1 signal peptidase I [Terrilactibacillus tamarindi]